MILNRRRKVKICAFLTVGLLVLMLAGHTLNTCTGGYGITDTCTTYMHACTKLPSTSSSEVFQGQGEKRVGNAIQLEDYRAYTEYINEEREKLLHVLQGDNKTFIGPKPPFLQFKEESPEFYNQSKHSKWMKVIIFYKSTRYNVGNISSIRDIKTVMWQRSPIFPFYIQKHLCPLLTLPAHIGHAQCDNHFRLNATGNAFPSPDDKDKENEFSRHFLYYSRVSVTLFRDAVVSRYGNVWSGSVQVTPHMCWIFREPEILGNHTTFPLYREILVLSQYFGDRFYHFNAEAMPRLVPYLGFIAENPGVVIHVPHGGLCGYYSLLGVDCARLVWGEVRGRVVYLPQGGGCMHRTNPLLTQQLSNLFLSLLPPPPPGPRSVLLVQRTRDRALLQHGEIAALLQGVARYAGLEFRLFADGKQQPSQAETRMLFRGAALVVAPHGAGLVNTFYTEPPAVVVEVLCKLDYPVVCFHYLSQNLGHRHFSLQASKGCGDGMTVDMAKFTELINYVASKYVIK